MIQKTHDGHPSHAKIVPLNAYSQITWERDVAIGQLQQIGKSLGEEMDDIAKVVRCKDCTKRNEERWCAIMAFFCNDDYFCASGIRKDIAYERSC